jgi:uncharacterized protein (DUF983 family)
MIKKVGQPEAEHAGLGACLARTQRSMTLPCLLRRAFRLCCPVCGAGRMFRGLFAMNRRCSHCGLWFERAPGYFLGSIYVNYAATGLIASVLYLAPMLWTGRPITWLIGPVVGFCVVFPIVFFRYARSLWLAFDHYLSPLDPAECPAHERSALP